VTRRGTDWLLCNERSNFDATALPQPRIFGANQLGTLWIDPQILAHLRPGQVLDRDPASGWESFVQQGPQQGTLVIGERCGAGSRFYTYDLQSGYLTVGTTRDEFPETATVMVREVRFGP
jgi:hypothetical protein